MIILNLQQKNFPPTNSDLLRKWPVLQREQSCDKMGRKGSCLKVALDSSKILRLHLVLGVGVFSPGPRLLGRTKAWVRSSAKSFAPTKGHRHKECRRRPPPRPPRLRDPLILYVWGLLSLQNTGESPNMKNSGGMGLRGPKLLYAENSSCALFTPYILATKIFIH